MVCEWFNTLRTWGGVVDEPALDGLGREGMLPYSEFLTEVVVPCQRSESLQLTEFYDVRDDVTMGLDLIFYGVFFKIERVWYSA